MRLGVFSDAHANVEALSAVWEAYRKEGIDAFYSLGDTVGYGASPNECSDMVRDKVAATVLGNHDAAVAGRMDYSYYYEAARKALDTHAEQLTASNMQWLKSLPYQLPLEEEDILLCHGSPVNVEQFDYVFAPEQARECMTVFEQLPQLTLIGHSHLCKVFALTGKDVEELTGREIRLEQGKKYIISVGSVGQPRDYDNRACYTIFDTKSRVLEFRRVEYDIEQAAQRIFRSKLDRGFGNRLFMGV